MQGDFEKWFATQGEGEEPMALPPSHTAPGGSGGSSRGTPLPSPQRQAAGAQQSQGGQQGQQGQGQQPIVSERMMGPPPLTGNEEVEQHVKSAVLAAPQLAWPPGADSPGSWLRGALGTRAPAAHGPTGGCSAAVGPGQTLADIVADVITQVDQEIMAFYKAREKLVHDRMARAQ